MGYSHHFTQKKSFSHKKWHAFTEFVEKLSHYKPTICGPDGTGHPVITSNDVMFNGDAGVGESYDTFHVSRAPESPHLLESLHNERMSYVRYEHMSAKYKGFRFCKTNRKPYDASVVACLIFIANMDKDIMKITSNGKISDWHEGLYLCRAVCPHMNLTIPDLE